MDNLHLRRFETDAFFTRMIKEHDFILLYGFDI